MTTLRERTVSSSFLALLPTGLVVLFGFLVFQNPTLAFLSLGLFLLLLFGWILRSPPSEIGSTFGLTGCRWYWIAGAAVGGLFLALLQRWDQGAAIFPRGLGPFAVLAMLIGLTEELVFRGFVFGRIQSSGSSVVAVGVSTIAHTLYKVAIFLPFAAIDPLFLGGLTFAVGLILGGARMATRSIWPCVVFHVLFDLWVYGDGPVPWWVW